MRRKASHFQYQIYKQIESIRGITNPNFQLRTNRNRPELIQLEKEVHGQGNQIMWGLRDRDLPISKEQEKNLFDLICSKFNAGKKYIELSDLENLIEQCDFDHNISTLQVIRMLAAYTSNSDKDNEYFSIDFGRKRIPIEGFFRLQNRIKFSYKDFK